MHISPLQWMVPTTRRGHDVTKTRLRLRITRYRHCHFSFSSTMSSSTTPSMWALRRARFRSSGSSSACGTRLNDPLMGQLSDRTHSRLGRRIPYILFGAVPLGVCFALIWSPPLAASPVALIVYFAVLVFAFDTLWTLIVAGVDSPLPRDVARPGRTRQCVWLARSVQPHWGTHRPGGWPHPRAISRMAHARHHFRGGDGRLVPRLAAGQQREATRSYR